MAKKSENPIPTQQSSETTIKNFLGALLNGSKDSHFNLIERKPQTVISSGSLKMDRFVKVKSGTSIRVGGPAGTGKTSSSLLFISNYLNTMPKSRAIYINAESKFSDEIKKNSNLKFVENQEEWSYGTVFILHSNCFDAICNMLVGLFRQMVEHGEHLGVIIDSIDMMILSSATASGSITDGKKPAGVNFLTKELFRRISHLITASNGFLIAITQYSATFTMSAYEKEAPSLMDGNQTHALNHQVSTALYYRPRFASNYILESENEKPDPIKNQILGVYAKVEVKKDASDNVGYTLEIPIKKGRTGNAIWVEKELFDVLLLINLLSKAGAWITFSDIVINWAAEYDKQINEENQNSPEENKKPLLNLKVKHQGLSQFSDYFEQNQLVLNWLIGKMKTIYT